MYTSILKMFFFFSPKALAAPLLLKAKETIELSGETCAALHLCLELLSKQEEVAKQIHHLNQACISMYRVGNSCLWGLG